VLDFSQISILSADFHKGLNTSNERKSVK